MKEEAAAEAEKRRSEEVKETKKLKKNDGGKIVWFFVFGFLFCFSGLSRHLVK